MMLQYYVTTMQRVTAKRHCILSTKSVGIKTMFPQFHSTLLCKLLQQSITSRLPL